LPVGPCELLRIHYRFGRRLRVLFRLATGRGWVWISGRAFPEGQAEAAFHRAAAAATAQRGRLRRVLHATDLAAVFWTFPNDRKLVSLKTLLCQALATPVKRAGSGQMLVLEAVDGRRIVDLVDGEAVTGTELLGTALAAFHTLAPPPEVPRFTRHEPPRLADAARLLARACPSVGRQAEALAAELLRRFEPSADPHVCLHGDVHAKNGILAGNRAALVALDKVCLGEPAADVGSYLSLLRYEHLIG